MFVYTALRKRKVCATHTVDYLHELRLEQAWDAKHCKIINNQILLFIISTDIQRPHIQCPANIEVDTEANKSYATVNWTIPVPTDNSNEALKAIGLYPPRNIEAGRTEIKYAVADSTGLSSNCKFTIHVKGICRLILQLWEESTSCYQRTTAIHELFISCILSAMSCKSCSMGTHVKREGCITLHWQFTNIILYYWRFRIYILVFSALHRRC